MQSGQRDEAVFGSSDMNHSPTKMEQSIRQRILNISRERKEDFQFLLIRYALERFLYRLSKSSYAESFILKGALLLTVWTDQRYRPTRDLDLLGIGDSTPQKLKTTIRKICQTDVEPDGLTFNVDGISITEIRDDQEYGGEFI